MDSRDELMELIRKIPRGKVVSYGALGRVLNRPVSGFLVGRMMRQCPEGVPWWRVVAKDGRLPVDKLDPQIGAMQRKHLENERVEWVCEGQVAASVFIDPNLL